MKKLISCEFNFDTVCVELKFSDGSMIAIYTIAVENEVARNMYERSELDYLIYNAPLEYADLILYGDPEVYLKTVTEYKPIGLITTYGFPYMALPDMEKPCLETPAQINIDKRNTNIKNYCPIFFLFR